MIEQRSWPLLARRPQDIVEDVRRRPDDVRRRCILQQRSQAIAAALESDEVAAAPVAASVKGVLARGSRLVDRGPPRQSGAPSEVDVLEVHEKGSIEEP